MIEILSLSDDARSLFEERIRDLARETAEAILRNDEAPSGDPDAAVKADLARGIVIDHVRRALEALNVGTVRGLRLAGGEASLDPAAFYVEVDDEGVRFFDETTPAEMRARRAAVAVRSIEKHARVNMTSDDCAWLDAFKAQTDAPSKDDMATLETLVALTQPYREEWNTEEGCAKRVEHGLAVVGRHMAKAHANWALLSDDEAAWLRTFVGKTDICPADGTLILRLQAKADGLAKEAAEIAEAKAALPYIPAPRECKRLSKTERQWLARFMFEPRWNGRDAAELLRLYSEECGEEEAA
jgi:hypothetical protein